MEREYARGASLPHARQVQLIDPLMSFRLTLARVQDLQVARQIAFEEKEEADGSGRETNV